jgi:CHAT domain-containing protein
VLAFHAASPSGNTLFAMAPERAHLRYAEQEVRDVSRFFAPQTLVLTGKGATKDAFKQSAESYQFVHLATHGYLNKFRAFAFWIGVGGECRGRRPTGGT